MKELSFAIIGCGSIAKNNHFPNIRRIPEIRLKALVDTNPKNAEYLAQKSAIKDIKILTDYLDLSKLDIDAAMILTPPSTHAKIAIDCAKAGMHIFCEKPLATNVEDAKKIVNTVSKSNVKLMVGFNFRFLHHFVKIKEMIQKGVLGKIWGFSGHFLGNITIHPNVTKYQFKKNGGGCLFDTGIHLIDLVRWLFGEIELVNASTKTLSLDIPVDDTATANLYLRNGINGTIFVTWCGPDHQALEVFGTKGVAYTIVQQNAVYYKRKEWFAQNFAVIEINNPVSSYLVELKHFCRAIIEDRDPDITGEDGVKALKIIKRAYQSSETGKLTFVE